METVTLIALVLSGIESLVVVLAIIFGGIWTLIIFGPFQQVRRAKAELTAIEQKIKEQAVIHITIDAVQASLPNDPSFFISITVNLYNEGTRIAALVHLKSRPLSVASFSFKDDGELELRNTIRVPVPTGSPPWLGTALLPGDSGQIPFFVRLKEPGLYMLQFSTQANPVERDLALEAGELEDTIPVAWEARKFFVVHDNRESCS